jgi:hypothetical protein
MSTKRGPFGGKKYFKFKKKFSRVGSKMDIIIY